MNIECAISPCPNDTFTFGPIAQNLIDSPIKYTFHFADIETLNQHALNQSYPLIKISLALLPQLQANYVLLKVGCVLGYGCGPKVISCMPLTSSQINSSTIALPGKHTTACQVFRRLFPKAKNFVYCPYNQIYSYLRNGLANCGVIIHESRFTFLTQGFYEIVDLGHLWEETMQLPLPLGGLVLHRSLLSEKSTIEKSLKDSLKAAFRFREELYPFIQKHSQEKDKNIIDSHIQLYVTDETQSLSLKGIQAIQRLINRESL